MAVLNFNGAVLQRTYISEALGAGARTVSATVTATRNAANQSVVLSTISPVPNMTTEELADWQAFVNLIDEETTLTVSLVALDVDCS